MSSEEVNQDKQRRKTSSIGKKLRSVWRCCRCCFCFRCTCCCCDKFCKCCCHPYVNQETQISAAGSLALIGVSGNEAGTVAREDISVQTEGGMLYGIGFVAWPDLVAKKIGNDWSSLQSTLIDSGHVSFHKDADNIADWLEFWAKEQKTNTDTIVRSALTTIGRKDILEELLSSQEEATVQHPSKILLNSDQFALSLRSPDSVSPVSAASPLNAAQSPQSTASKPTDVNTGSDKHPGCASQSPVGFGDSSSEGGESDEEGDEEYNRLSTRKITRIIRLDPDGHRKEFVFEGEAAADTQTLIDRAIKDSPFAEAASQGVQLSGSETPKTSTRRVVLKKQVLKKTVITEGGDERETVTETSRQVQEQPAGPDEDPEVRLVLQDYIARGSHSQSPTYAEQSSV